MSFDLNQVPHTIAGTEPQPKLYGKSANQRYFDFNRQAADEFQRTGNTEAIEKVRQASVRYTPKGTLAKGQVTDEAVENAVGYAQGEIEHLDRDGDGALNQKEVVGFFLEPFITQLNQLIAEYQTLAQDPNATREQKQALIARFQQVEEVTMLALAKASNIFASTDIPDENGRRDGKLTADEVAAKTLFDDAANDMFEDNKAAYQTITNALQSKPGYDGPSFESLEQRIAAIQQKAQRHRMAMDGRITQGERDIADTLVDAPIPTNQVVKAIHNELHLKARVARVQEE